jgi:hypothetical protein
MAEDFGIVHYKSFTPNDAFSAVSAIAACIAAATGGYWEVDSSITVASGELALKAKSQTFSPPPTLGDPNNQRIAIRAQAGQILQIAYAPDGWDSGTADFTDIAATSTKPWSDFRNITGSASGFGALSNTVWLVQYRDELATVSPYPGSTLTILLGNSSNYLYGCHAGRGLSMDNRSDPQLDLHGDCLLVGQPSDHLVNNSWLRGDNAVGGVNASIVKSGATWFNYCRITDDPTAAMKNPVGGFRRMVPYNVHGFGRAIPTPRDATTHCGILGQMKYIREAPVATSIIQIQRSVTDLNQRWKSMIWDATTTRDQVILWGPETEVP